MIGRLAMRRTLLAELERSESLLLDAYRQLDAAVAELEACRTEDEEIADTVATLTADVAAVVAATNTYRDALRYIEVLVSDDMLDDAEARQQIRETCYSTHFIRVAS